MYKNESGEWNIQNKLCMCVCACMTLAFWHLNERRSHTKLNTRAERWMFWERLLLLLLLFSFSFFIYPIAFDVYMLLCIVHWIHTTVRIIMLCLSYLTVSSPPLPCRSYSSSHQACVACFYWNKTPRVSCTYTYVLLYKTKQQQRQQH